jgi:CheY-like chemotaxis protein
MSGVCVDITERKHAEQRLRQQAADLSEADRRKNEFLAMLAHELRNPLAPIRNTIELLGMNGDGDRDAALRMMARQTDQLARLVDDLLDVSRVSQGKIALRTSVIDLASVVRHAAESAKPTASATGQTLDVVLPNEALHVEGDEARLKQVVDNLLNNAMKFTPHDGHIALTLKRADQEAVITVQDNGIGISPDEIGHIFGLFVQSDSTLVRSTNGLGIGLTLAKNLVEMHDGHISAHSEGEGNGSTFTVRLPLVKDRALATTPAAPERTAPSAPRRILVVDDNHDAAGSLAMLLTRTGHTVRTAFDGLEAIATAATFQPEVMLLDIGLPNLNGYEVAQRIRKEAWGRNIYLVALTGWGQEEDRNKSTAAGFDMHLVKPVDLAKLKALLAGPLERIS